MVPTTQEVTLEHAIGRVREPFLVVEQPGGGIGFADPDSSEPNRVVGYLPACRPENLGDTSFCADHGLRFPYVSGAMANGIGSVEIVEAMGRAGMLGVFGAAGLSLERVESAIRRLEASLGQNTAYGINLIHSPSEPELESAVADLFLRRGVKLVEASAFLDLTLPIVRYRVKGLKLDREGRITATNRVIAKVSRVEVASKFLAPAPAKYLDALVASGDISREQAEWATRVPIADDITAEADSGGHTDNQPAIVLLPTMIALRDRLQARHGYERTPRIGAAGGISTPWSGAAALAMGASYLVVGSVNQACVESGTSDAVRKMLAQAQQADIAMAPAADMFEMGVKVQVLKRGTMFAMRGAKLYEIYRANESLESLSDADRSMLEKNIFRVPLDTIWRETQAFFQKRDPKQIDRALREPKHKMALVFRWYLGLASHWANSGEPSRAVDYQIWCGPAMAAFNDWVKGSFLEAPENRGVAVVAYNILYGAAVLNRARILSGQGIAIPPGTPRLVPRPLAEIEERIGT